MSKNQTSESEDEIMAIPIEIWVVLQDKKEPVYCAGYKEACHEHINDAINEHDIEEARTWTVHRATVSPGTVTKHETEI